MKLHNTKRIDLKDLDIPTEIKIESVRNVTKAPTDTVNGIESEIVLPLDICKSSNIEQFVGIVVNKCYYFSKFDLEISKRVHDVKSIQRDLAIEDKWPQRVAKSSRTPCSSLTISQEILKEFKNRIQHGCDNHAVNKELSRRFLYSDLRLLVGQRWINLAIIEVFTQIFNGSRNESTKIYSLNQLKNLESKSELKYEVFLDILSGLPFANETGDHLQN